MRHHLCSSVELLEDRIAPAALLAMHANYIKYLDSLGDQVTVTFSKSFINSTNVDSIFTFSTLPSPAVSPQLSIDLTQVPHGTTALNGVSITVSVKEAHGGVNTADIGTINAAGINLGTVKIAGALGSINAGAGSALKDAARSVTVGTLGATGSATCTFEGTLPKLTVSGIKGVQSSMGDLINIEGALTSASINGDVTGAIMASGNIVKLAITGNVVGGTSADSGYISSSLGYVGAVTIGGNLDGSAASATHCGAIISASEIKSVTVGGSVIGGSNDYTGLIDAGFGIGPVKIGQNLIAGSGTNSGEIRAGANLTSLTVGQNIEAGASVRANSQIGPIKVTGSISGTQAQPVIIAAPGVTVTKAKSDVAIASLAVGQDMDYAVVLAGYKTNLSSTDLSAVDPNAQIGAVTVGGNFTASDLVAGVQGTMNGSSFVFGTASDAAISGPLPVSASILSKIASVTIHGAVAGDSVSGASYGITAEYVDAVKIGTVVESLLAGANNDLFSTSHQLSLASNVTVDEVAS